MGRGQGTELHSVTGTIRVAATPGSYLEISDDPGLDQTLTLGRPIVKLDLRFQCFSPAGVIFQDAGLAKQSRV